MNHFNIVLALAEAAMRGDADASTQQAQRLVQALSLSEPNLAEELAGVVRNNGSPDFTVDRTKGAIDEGRVGSPRLDETPLKSGPITDSVKPVDLDRLLQD